MIEKAITISLQIAAIYILFQQEMLLGKIRIFCANFLDRKFSLSLSRQVQKPLWDCFTCMASVWTIILTRSFDLKLILLVCGINWVLGTIILRLNESDT